MLTSIELLTLEEKEAAINVRYPGILQQQTNEEKSCFLNVNKNSFNKL